MIVFVYLLFAHFLQVGCISVVELVGRVVLLICCDAGLLGSGLRVMVD